MLARSLIFLVLLTCAAMAKGKTPVEPTWEDFLNSRPDLRQAIEQSQQLPPFIPPFPRPPLPPLPKPTLIPWDPLHLFPSGTTAVNTNPITALQSFAIDDLQAALKDALAQTPPDTTAANCYTALIPLVQANAVNPIPSNLGIFTAFQKARDIANSISTIQSNLTGGPLNTACAPLVLSAENTILLLAAQVGVKVAIPPLLPMKEKK